MHPQLQCVRSRAYQRRMAAREHPLAGHPVVSAEFLVIDTETNGLGGDA